MSNSISLCSSSHALSVLTAESPLDLSLENNHHVVIEEARARGGSTGSKGKKSVFLPPFTPVGNCETAPGLSPRL